MSHNQQYGVRPRPTYIDTYDPRGGRRQVLKREPTLTCYCGKEHPVVPKGSDRTTYVPCVRCNATFYVIAHEGPYMEPEAASDA